MRNRECSVQLALISDVMSSDEITRYIGLTPDRCWNKGDSFTWSHNPNRGSFRISTCWFLIERDGDVDDWEVTASRVLARIQGKQQLLRHPPADLKVSVLFLVTESNDVFGFGLSSEIVAALAEIGASIDMSFVVDVDEARDEGGAGRSSPR